MADFRLRIQFAKTGAAIWLSHLEVVRAMERCIRRSGLPYAISHGFSPHLKHSFSAALPVGTGSTGEYMDIDLESLVDSEQALAALKAAELKDMPVFAAHYVAKDEPSLQAYLNLATYRIEFELFRASEDRAVLEDLEGAIDDLQATDPSEAQSLDVSELFKRLQARGPIAVTKKGKPKTYDLENYIDEAWTDPASPQVLYLRLLSRPEGSLRPEVILDALSKPDASLKIVSLMRVDLEHRDLS